jgi:hypothetical protein
MPEFFETRMGKTFYESTLPRIVTALERIAAAMETQTPASLQGVLDTIEKDPALKASIVGLMKPEPPR